MGGSSFALRAAKKLPSPGACTRFTAFTPVCGHSSLPTLSAATARDLPPTGLEAREISRDSSCGAEFVSRSETSRALPTARLPLSRHHSRPPQLSLQELPSTSIRPTGPRAQPFSIQELLSPHRLWGRGACGAHSLSHHHHHRHLLQLTHHRNSNPLPTLALTRAAHADVAGGHRPAGGEEFPGARTEFTGQLSFAPERPEKPIPCFQVLDLHGNVAEGAEEYEVDQDLAVEMHRKMVLLQVMDSVFYEAQRQGRFSFYMTTAGEEAINIASAAALSHLDHIFAQYREPGVLLWRGFSLKEFSDQCLGNQEDSTKGRQMPIHYGSKALRFHTISSPLTTQVPHAVGAAYGLKMSEEDCCAVTYFGEGAASEGDFHAALNFAAVLEAPVLFICRNNGWAISTPSKEQYRGDGIAGRGQAYGMRSVRVDGNDVLAVHGAVKAAREQVVSESRPILLEALTYRTGHHSTSDDSSRYRGAAELAHWKMERDPTRRFQKWIVSKGWWTEEEEQSLREAYRKEVIAELEAAEKLPKPGLSEMFTDVYDKMPLNLVEQRERTFQAVRNNPSAYPPDVPVL